jgi:hypothetical protein
VQVGRFSIVECTKSKLTLCPTGASRGRPRSQALLRVPGRIVRGFDEGLVAGVHSPLCAGLMTPHRSPNDGLLERWGGCRAWETCGRGRWLGRETGDNERREAPNLKHEILNKCKAQNSNEINAGVNGSPAQVPPRASLAGARCALGCPAGAPSVRNWRSVAGLTPRKASDAMAGWTLSTADPGSDSRHIVAGLCRGAAGDFAGFFYFTNASTSCRAMVSMRWNMRAGSRL